MTSPDDGAEAQVAPEPSATSRGGTGTRTPPPRTRRGAPPARAAAGEDNGARAGGPRPTPGSAKIFDWDGAEVERSASGSVAAAAATAVAPLPQEVPAPTEPVEPEFAAEPGPRAAKPVRAPKAKAAKRQERRFRQTIVKVDLWSVTKMALCFYISAMGVVMVSLVALWTVADSAGIIDNVENFIGDLFSSEDFQFVSGEVLRGAALVSVVVVALLVVFTIIAASFYNIFAELFGGIEVVIREEEQPAKR